MVERVVAYLVVTYLTPTGTYLEVIEPFYVAEEFFLVGFPGKGDGWEVAPCVLWELVGTVCSEVDGGEIAILEDVMDTTKEGESACAAHIVACFCLEHGGLVEIPVLLVWVEDVGT